MPKGDIKVKSQNWWSQKSTLEKVLLVLLALAIILIIIFIALLATKKSTTDADTKTTAPACSTPACIIESAKFLESIDPEINPCDNLYKHACGRFLSNSHGDENLALFHKLSEQLKRETLELYKESNNENDHKMVKTARNLFRACMNETEITRDNLRTIKEAIKLAGGWPVIDGAKWNVSNFDWIRSSAVLRKLGYYYSIFVDMQIDVDPNNASIPMLKVAPPNVWDFSSRNFDKIDFMIEVAEAFGVLNRKEASMEMTQANAFLLQMQFESHSKHMQISYRKYTVEEFQGKFGEGLVDWLLFINNIVGRTAKITKDDHVLFPSPEVFKGWFEFISKTSKRTLANYMMWKVIEESLSYLTEDLRDRKARLTNRESREVFCLGETQRRFVPDPLAIIYTRRNLQDEKKKFIDDILHNIKSELTETISNKIKWMDEEDKENLIGKLKELKVVIGQPGNYNDDSILNDVDVDMVETKNTGFLSLLAQASRNRQTKLYNQIKAAQEDTLLEKWYMRGGGNMPFYSEDDNLLYIPTAVTKYYFFNEERPQYLNYGALGSQLSYQLTNIMGANLRHRERFKPWSNKTSEELQKISECLSNEAKVSTKPNSNLFKIEYSFQQTFASLSYSAWTKSKATDSNLVGIDGTPNKLFWLASVFVMCQPGPKSAYVENNFAEFVQTSPQFLKDFNCPAKTDYLEKCNFY